MTNQAASELLCPNCQHPRHLPGTECATYVHHGPSRFHLCLCLARPGAALACPPQMTCQGGTLGYSDIWYLQHGHTLVSDDGTISPEALRPDPTRVPAVPMSSPPPDQTALRDRIAAALYERERTPRGPRWPNVYASDRETFEAMADAVLVVLPPPADRAAVLSDAERTMLTYALDQAQEHIWSRDGFTDEDQAALTSLRRLAAEAQQTDTETRAVAPQPDSCATCDTERCETCHGCRCNKGDDNTCGHPECPATRATTHHDTEGDRS